MTTSLAAPTAAMLWSGGKDSTLALHRAIADGMRVSTLFNLYDAATQRVRFHGVRRELVGMQADALGLELLQLPLGPDNYEAVFAAGLQHLRDAGINTLILGNIHLADVRAWYEERTAAAGFQHAEPLWGSSPADVVREIVSLGYRARITGIDCARSPRHWLGRDLEPALLAEFEAAGIDPAGESGEYHTFVYAGPLFGGEVGVLNGGEREVDGFAFVDVLPGGPAPG